MKLKFGMFFSTEPKRYRVLPVELQPNVKGQRMCANCSKFIYNRLLRGPFCAKHLTPVNYYENCAYFKPIWYVKI